jgi:hypothetical protein
MLPFESGPGEADAQILYRVDHVPLSDESVAFIVA